jgi:hypothetical protein
VNGQIGLFALERSACRDFMEMISMTGLIRTDRAIDGADRTAHLSDDECLPQLARAVAAHDSEHLEEVARLIGRLAVTIE